MAAALAGLILVMEPPAKDATQWNTATQAGPIPTPEEIASYTTKLTKIMNVDIPSYTKGGGGNYKELDGNDKRKKAIEAWQKREWPDAKAESRKQKTPSANVPFWSTAATTKQDMEHRGGGKTWKVRVVVQPPSYRLDFGLYKGLTVPQVTRAGRKGKVASGAAYIGIFNSGAQITGIDRVFKTYAAICSKVGLSRYTVYSDNSGVPGAVVQHNNAEFGRLDNPELYMGLHRVPATYENADFDRK
eukprot:gene12974-16226_t